MRLRNTLIALAVLLVVGGYALVVRLYSRPVEARKALSVKPEEIAKIDLKYPDRELELERKPGAPWMIGKPLKTKADPSAANELARAISDCRITKTVEENPKDLAPFGLAKPRVVVAVTTTDGRTPPGIEVGKTTPIGFSTYIRLANGPAVMLAASSFQAEMTRTADQMRNRELMTFKVDDVKRFTLERDNGSEVEIVREKGRWKIVKPVERLADSTETHRLLSALAGAKIAGFVSDAPADLAPYGLERPRLIVTVYTGKTGGGRESLLFGAREREPGKNGIYVRRGGRPPVYTAPEWVLSNIDKSPLELRDKTVLRLDPSKVATVEAQANGKRFVLKRDGGEWAIVEEGKSSGADAAAVQTFLNWIPGLKGRSIVVDPMTNPRAFGMDAPAALFKFAGKDGKPLGEVKLSEVESRNPSPGATPGPSGADYYIASSESSALFSIDRPIFDQFAESAGHFHPRSHPAATAAPRP